MNSNQKISTELGGTELKLPEAREKGESAPIIKSAALGLDVNWEPVNLDEIDFEDHTFQYRLATSTADLRRSLEQEGQEEPVDLLKGFRKPYRIIDGSRRCTAARELGWKSIKAFIHDMDEEKALRFAFTKNVVRKDLTRMERANALWVAQKKGFARLELAAAFGISQSQVGRYLQLLEFAPELQRCIDGRVLTMAHAKVLADFGVKNPTDWKDRVAKQGLDARSLKKLLRKEVAGKLQVGRKKHYLVRTKDGFRMYAFTLTKNTPHAERERMASLLLEALKILEKALDRTYDRT